MTLYELVGQIPEHSSTADLVVWGLISIVLAAIPVGGSVYLAIRSTNKKLKHINEAVNGHHDERGEIAFEEDGTPRKTLSETVREIYKEQQKAAEDRAFLARTQQENYDHLLSLINDFGEKLTHHVEWEEAMDGKYSKIITNQLTEIQDEIKGMMDRMKPMEGFILGYSGSKLPDTEAVNALVDHVEALLSRTEDIQVDAGAVREILDSIQAELKDIEETQADLEEAQSTLTSAQEHLTETQTQLADAQAKLKSEHDDHVQGCPGHGDDLSPEEST